MPCMAFFSGCDFFRSAFCYDEPPSYSAFRSKINDMVRTFDHIQIVFNHDD